MTSLAADAGEALRMGRIDAILHYSRRSAAIFRDLAEAAGFAEPARLVPQFCISADAAAPLRGWASRVAVALEPNEAAMLAMLGVRDEGEG